MKTVIKFMGALMILSIVVGVMSLLWTKYSSSPRPEFFTNIREMILNNKNGLKVASVLGVSDDSRVTPLNFNELSKNAFESVVNRAETYTANVVFLQAARQLANQFELLTPAQQSEVRRLICNQEALSTKSAEIR